MHDSLLLLKGAVVAALFAGSVTSSIAAPSPAEASPSDSPTARVDSSVPVEPPELPPRPTGTGRIIDSQGRVLHLTFEAANTGFDREAWLARTEEFERRRAEAEAENERLRLQWIAEERQHARAVAERQAGLEAEMRWAGRNTPGWVVYGPDPRGSRQGHTRPGSRERPDETRRLEPTRSVFLPTPNLTSPFPHSSTKDPNSNRKSFLP